MLRPTTAEVKGFVPNINTNTHARQQNVNSSFVPSFDTLPKQFISQMRTLFDILDDKHTGFVRFSDIEKGWQDDGCKGLPGGVIDSLRKLTPANGLLSFERFCAGLKLSLLRNQSDMMTNAHQHTSALSSPSTTTTTKCKSPHRSKSARSPSAPPLQIENPLPNAPWNNNGNPTATIRPRNHTIMSPQRALSLPQLSPDSSEVDAVEIPMVNISSPPPPPKPPRASAVVAAAHAAHGGINNRLSTGNKCGATMDKCGVKNALQNWQMGMLLSEMEEANDKLTNSTGAYYTNRGCADGGSSSATDSLTSAHATHAIGGTHTKKASSSSNGMNGGNSNKRRGETRRHTLQNGIDYNMLRRLKQYEEEREVILLGIDAVEKTRNWYLQQLDNVQEKIRCLGRMGENVDHWSEVQHERLNFQRARVLEINRSLAALADGWDRGCFPLHFNLAISHSNKNLAPVAPKSHLSSSSQDHHSLYLLSPGDHVRNQNRYITVNDVKRLEREKEALLRELFELRQYTSNTRIPPRVLTISQAQSSPVCSTTSSGGGGLVDADVVY